MGGLDCLEKSNTSECESEGCGAGTRRTIEPVRARHQQIICSIPDETKVAIEVSNNSDIDVENWCLGAD